METTITKRIEKTGESRKGNQMETVYEVILRAGHEVGALRYMPASVAHDYREATPRRIRAAARKCLMEGAYGGRLVFEHLTGQPGPILDTSAIHSVASVLGYARTACRARTKLVHDVRVAAYANPD
jgi:hypothetical protein